MSQPVPDQFQPLALDAVDAHPALPFVIEQPCLLKDPEVPRGRLPSVIEDRRDLSGCHRTPIEIDRHQYASSGGMR